MCDYSLMGVPNRLAQEGEDLVTHRFRTGSLGLAPAGTQAGGFGTTTGFWSMLKTFLRGEPGPAVAVRKRTGGCGGAGLQKGSIKNRRTWLSGRCAWGLFSSWAVALEGKVKKNVAP